MIGVLPGVQHNCSLCAAFESAAQSAAKSAAHLQQNVPALLRLMLPSAWQCCISCSKCSLKKCGPCSMRSAAIASFTNAAQYAAAIDGNFLLLKPYHGEHGPKVPVTPEYIVLQRVLRKAG
jgi:hypothetical protein